MVIRNLLLCLFAGCFLACKPEYRVATEIHFAVTEEVPDSLRQVTRTLLAERLQRTHGEAFTLAPLPKGFRVISRHRNQPIAAMAGLIGTFGSATWACYPLVDQQDDRLQTALTDFYWPAYLARTQGAGYVVATTANTARQQQVLDKLAATLPPGSPLRFCWSAPLRVAGSAPRYALYALAETAGQPRIDNRSVASAEVRSVAAGEIGVAVQLRPAAATAWAALTERASQEGFPLAMVVNEAVIDTLHFRSPQTEGTVFISGGFTVETAEALARQLVWAPLPVPLKITSQEVIE